MTIKSNYFVLCETFIVDNRQRVSLINIYDTNWAEQYPVTYPLLRFAANLNIKGPDQKTAVEVSLIIDNPGSEPILQSPPIVAKLVPKLSEQNIGTVFEVQAVTFPKPGRYPVRLLAEGEEVADSFIDLKLTLPPED